jgi:hypothetical protein
MGGKEKVGHPVRLRQRHQSCDIKLEFAEPAHMPGHPVGQGSV